MEYLGVLLLSVGAVEQGHKLLLALVLLDIVGAALHPGLTELALSLFAGKTRVLPPPGGMSQGKLRRTTRS